MATSLLIEGSAVKPVGRPRTCDCGACKKCKWREYMRGWYATKTLNERRRMLARRDPEAVRAAERRRYQKRKDSAFVVCNRAASVAIARGKLVKAPCAFCGSTDNIEGHHEDYAKPLEVIWLCRLCHQTHHYIKRGVA